MLLRSGPGCQTNAHLCSLFHLLSRWIADPAPQLSVGSWLAYKGQVEQGEACHQDTCRTQGLQEPSHSACGCHMGHAEASLQDWILLSPLLLL